MSFSKERIVKIINLVIKLKTDFIILYRFSIYGLMRNVVTTQT